ncbi:HD domain-containing protein [Candidatus Haliotispira prima]|uniref:HD domain-containing protein n=1 Tax=Candidatus Haliotispira prima TaxID=3034016 RepID=A0ABY8ME76_9SPIO|nr:HD domain-containing protein [Candidatus Haliotispira prima]
MTIDKKLDLILEIDQKLNQTQDVELLLDQILYEARMAVRADAGSIYTVENNRLCIRSAQNDTLDKDKPENERSKYLSITLDIDDSTISGYAASHGEMINISDMYKIDNSAPYQFSSRFDEETGYHTKSSISFPLITNQNEVLGVLQLLNAQDGDEGREEVIAFRKEDEAFLGHYAAVATVALQRAKMTRAILMRMIRTASLRDPKETGAHVNRVGTFAVEVYKSWAKRRNLGLTETMRYCDNLRMAAMLHDVGKVGISDVILKKPARLTEEEFRVMQGHTVIGAELFRNKESELDAVARNIALRHHENWDGSGYPGYVDEDTWEPLALDENGKNQGLKGEEIPIEARIVALCDVFDALSSVRVYKDSWSKEEVREELQNSKGSKFDPELVEIFLEIYPIIEQIQNHYKDD